MLAGLRHRSTYANVMATAAVFIALGGGAYAATRLPANSVGSRQLKENAGDAEQGGASDGQALQAAEPTAPTPRGPHR
jgi:hypothetical protein